MKLFQETIQRTGGNSRRTKPALKEAILLWFAHKNNSPSLPATTANKNT